MSDQPQLKDCRLEIEDRTAILTFCRDDVRNALTSTEITSELPAVLQWCSGNPAISALIITGEGSAFSAGGNIKTMGQRAKAPAHELQQNYKRGVQRIPMAFEQTEIPVIAAVNGPAIGAGFDIVNMCDIRIGSVNAQFGETFVNLGIIPGDGGAWFLTRIVGPQRAAEMTLTGRIVKAEEAVSLGILLEAVDPDELLPRAKKLAARIGEKPPQAIRYAKRLLKMAQRQGIEEHLDLCSAFQAICHKTEDHQEALTAFFEKRPGRFQGR